MVLLEVVVIPDCDKYLSHGHISRSPAGDVSAILISPSPDLHGIPGMVIIGAPEPIFCGLITNSCHIAQNDIAGAAPN
jgi:hypothetical protein